MEVQNRCNLIVVGFDDIKVNQICVLLTNVLDLYFLSLEDLIEYSIMDRIEIDKTFGKDYILKKEKSIIKSLNDYENSIINPGFQRFFQFIENFKNFDIVYLRQNKENVQDVISQIVFEERDMIVSQLSKLVLNDSLTNEEIVSQILLFLRGKKNEN